MIVCNYNDNYRHELHKLARINLLGHFLIKAIREISVIRVYLLIYSF